MYYFLLSDSMDLDVILLHRYPEYKEQCCRLINEEWKRSETARMRSLDNSYDTLPTSLVLIRDKKVLGHCRLSVIPSMPTSCFIETVVIDKSLRGIGLGSYLMKKAEEYCESALRLKCIYLSTKDQVPFYSKLGYCVCEPVSIYGCFTPIATTNKPKLIGSDDKSPEKVLGCGPSPPPPPLPTIKISIENVQRKVYMCKQLNM